MYRVTPTTCLRPRRYFQQHGRWSSTYDQTLKNLTLTSETRIIYQGFTGKQATANAMQSIDYGTKVVGGVTPRKSGQHLKLPLFSSVKEAADNLKPHATAIFVPAPFAVSAITESIAAEIPLIIAVAEHVSIHSLLRLHSILKTQSRSRLVGANCPGIINPAARCRVGFMPHKVFTPGVVGIVAKSGTLSYEAVASTSRAGLGQSLVVGMGGDWIAGTTLVDGVKFFLEDEGTKGIVVIGEVGGDVEMRVVALLEEVKGRNGGALTKPVMGLVAGLTAQEGKVMGHAGAIRAPGDPTVEEKIKALSRAGVEMVSQPAQFGPGMVKLLDAHYPSLGSPLHNPKMQQQQKRSLHNLSRKQTRTLLKKKILPERNTGVNIRLANNRAKEGDINLILSIDRNTSGLKFLLYVAGGEMEEFPTPFSTPPSAGLLRSTYLKDRDEEQLAALTRVLYNIFIETEACMITTSFSYIPPYRSLFLSLPATTISPDPVTQPTPKHNIVYIPYPPFDSPRPRVGTIVNGAGLSMNTLDILTLHGLHPSNMLDTGGKATAETIWESFRMVLSDTSVKVLFVNVFGGLTLCDVIAKGIVLAFKEVGIEVPVVVRLRGMREKEGWRIESKLPIFAFDDLEDAVEKVKELVAKG